jgi:hypothetical protein
MHVRRSAQLATAAALIAIVAGCSIFGSDRASSPGSGTAVLDVATNGTADGPGLAIREVPTGGGSQLLVNGSLVIDPAGTAWLCEALGESFPPTCVGPRLRVVNLDDATAASLTAGSGARWSDRPVQLFGTIRPGS